MTATERMGFTLSALSWTRSKQSAKNGSNRQMIEKLNGGFVLVEATLFKRNIVGFALVRDRNSECCFRPGALSSELSSQSECTKKTKIVCMNEERKSQIQSER
ncbi:hypothetical protein ANCCEY_09774 [Ancylostoma ceylanicum]|uniref:Uncharacterized protein n=1 Tax=Ancylostoma ceylanicum TaxID=53326 RepID=A0A0D6LGM7_9BILA|nr:hypothetical protein ANCCEY_09774 [Ancylostoma ceylanicum]